MPAPFHRNIAFNAHHSPMGAYFTFTCGHFSTRGGLGVQLGKPAGQDLFIGIKDGGRYAPVPLQVLPFFDGAAQLDPRAAYLPQAPGADPQRFAPYTNDQTTREYGHATDRWKTPDFEFSIYTPFGPIPDPATADDATLREALLPAITAELIVDNRTGATPKTAFFAINFHEGGTRILDTGLPPTHAGFALRAHLGVSAHVVDLTSKEALPPTPFVFLRWWPHEGLEDRSNPVHLLGTTPGAGIEVPPGKKFALRLTLGCHLREIVTTRLEGRYFYNRCYASLVDVLNAGATRFCDLKKAAKALDERLAASGLNPDQQFLIAHATRSYYGNTQLLEIDNQPYWIVNEGEYCMMNTLDLAADQVFWELEQNPWVVKNLLDNFVKRYSYVDQVKIPTTESTETTTEKSSVTSVTSVVQPVPHSLAPGGLSFCHDQGSHNQFSPFGHSAYELKDLTGCFSYMTQEQLCNWILIAATYLAQTNDTAWVLSNMTMLRACYESLQHRLNGRPTSSKGPDQWRLECADSEFTGSGQEITTYDSLDSSLGQARNSLYLATKACAAFFGLSLVFEQIISLDAHSDSIDAEQCALRIARAVNSRFSDERGYLPAVFETQSTGFSSRIVPAIEALMFILPSNLSKLNLGGPAYVELLAKLRSHTQTLLSDPDRRNHFSDGGIKLSSTSNNSWLSKIAIVQHVARTLFNLDENGNERPAPFRAATVRERPVIPLDESLPDGRGSEVQPISTRAAGWETADAAHATWLTTGPGAYWCACDQIINGEAKGSRYYPRLITTALWLTE